MVRRVTRPVTKTAPRGERGFGAPRSISAAPCQLCRGLELLGEAEEASVVDPLATREAIAGELAPPREP
jgi:hypothetical protein